MQEKECFRCHQVKPLTDFYRHPRMGDGHLNKCKECTKRDVALNYAARREKYSAYEHERNHDPERRHKKQEYQKTHRLRFPEKYRARQAVTNAIRDGKLERQPCHFCGNSKSQAHHLDYNQPFDLEWACFKCHREQYHGQVVVVETV
jgi:ribosomal protein S27AE